jgi:general secretion pathway protein C
VRETAPALPEPGESTKLQPLSSYEAIAQFNMFGAAPEQTSSPSASPKTQDNVPVTDKTGNLRLKGTIVDRANDYGLAILEDIKTREQNLYHPGDRIGNGTLVSVARDSVTLRENGQDTRLMIFDDVTPARPERTSPTPPRPEESSEPTGPEPPVEDEAQEPLAQDMGDNRYVVSREALGDKMDDLSYFMSNVRIQPFFKDGQPHGFKVAAVKAGSPVESLGLKRGDVVLMVNNVTLSKPEDMFNLYRQLQQMDTVTVEVERQGKTETLTYSLR